MHDRIKIWIESKGLKSSSFADKIGVNRATISHILSGRNKPSIDFLKNDILISRFKLKLDSIRRGFYVYSNETNENLHSKKIKIVVFYDDNSFEELNS